MNLKSFVSPLLIGAALSAGTFAGFVAVQRPVVASGHAQAATEIATIDLYALLELRLRSEELIAARDDAVAPLADQLEQLQQRLQTLAAQIQGQGVDSPESAPLITEFQTLQPSVQQLQQEVNTVATRTYASQMMQAHSEIIAAADAVASEAGYDVVLASRGADRPLDEGPIDVMVQELLARPVVRAPAGVDLTEKVRERLGLPDPSLEDDAAADESSDAVETPAADQAESGE